jgi:hypothetical protein
MFLMLLVEFVAFPKKDNAIFAKNKQVAVESSGSIGLYYDSKCRQTYPNETLTSNSRNEWCSNIAKPGEAKPWISYSIPNKAMKLTGFAVRNGCCFYVCCCTDDQNYDATDFCCCRLYSFSLQGSNDNVTWTIIHKVEKTEKFDICMFMTYEFAETKPYTFIKFALDEEYPNCPICVQINQIELYGSTVDSHNMLFGNADDEDDGSVSIIGKIKRNDHE